MSQSPAVEAYTTRPELVGELWRPVRGGRWPVVALLHADSGGRNGRLS